MNDASIPMMGRPDVQLNDPQEVYGRMLSLKNMQAQQQLHQRQMAEDQKDEQIWTDNYKRFGGDLDQTEKGAIAGGASSRSAMKFRDSRNVAAINKAKLWKAEDDVQVARNDKLLPLLDGFRKKTPEQQTADWKNWATQAQLAGALSDEHYVALMKQHPTAPSSSELDDYRATMMSQSQIDKAADRRRKADDEEALAQSRKATTAKTVQAINKDDRDSVIGKLRGATTLDQWNQTLIDNGRDMNEFGPPTFDTQTGDGSTERTPDTAKLKRLGRMAMTQTQIETADAAEQRAVAAAATAEQRAVAAAAKEKQAEADRKITQGQAARRIEQTDEGHAIARGNAQITQQQRRVDAAQNKIDALQRKEDQLHAERTRIGELLDDPDITAENSAGYKAKMAGLKEQVTLIQQHKQHVLDLMSTPEPAKPAGETQAVAPAGGAAAGVPRASEGAAPGGAAKKVTEADIRAGAKRRGYQADGPEAEAAVKAARANGSLQ